MTVRLVTARDPRHLPEFTLWGMTKDRRVAEARTRIVPLGEGLPELRLYVTRADGTFELLWSLVLPDGHAVRELAREKQREFEVRGWTLDVARPDAPGGAPS